MKDGKSKMAPEEMGFGGKTYFREDLHPREPHGRGGGRFARKPTDRLDGRPMWRVEAPDPRGGGRPPMTLVGQWGRTTGYYADHEGQVWARLAPASVSGSDADKRVWSPLGMTVEGLRTAIAFGRQAGAMFPQDAQGPTNGPERRGLRPVGGSGRLAATAGGSVVSRHPDRGFYVWADRRGFMVVRAEDQRPIFMAPTHAEAEGFADEAMRRASSSSPLPHGAAAGDTLSPRPAGHPLGRLKRAQAKIRKLRLGGAPGASDAEYRAIADDAETMSVSARMRDTADAHMTAHAAHVRATERLTKIRAGHGGVVEPFLYQAHWDAAQAHEDWAYMLRHPGAAPEGLTLVRTRDGSYTPYPSTRRPRGIGKGRQG